MRQILIGLKDAAIHAGNDPSRGDRVPSGAAGGKTTRPLWKRPHQHTLRAYLQERAVAYADSETSMTENIDIASLLKRPEGETLDFKATNYNLSDSKSKRSFAKDLTSLANTPRDGDAYLILGVKEQGDGSYKPLGINKPVDDADLQSVAESLLTPCPRFQHQVIRHGGVLLELITIPIGRSPVAPKRTLDNGFTEGTIYFRRGSQNAVASMDKVRHIVEWFQGQISLAEFNEKTTFLHKNLDADALLRGPVQALDLTSDVEEAAQSFASNAPAEAAIHYARVAEKLRDRFPGHAARFDQLRATALREAGKPDESHDVLMKLAIRSLFERVEPQLSPEVRRGLEELYDEVDEVRRARGGALIYFGRCHEHAGALQRLAECFDNLDSDDEYAPFIAVLLAEAALATSDFQTVLDRRESLQKAGARGDTSIGLRVRAALGDAGVDDVWPTLIKEAEALRFPAPEGTYVCLRGARWCARNGQIDKAESLYRVAIKLGSEAGLDLDVENALWSLTTLYALDFPSVELFETNRMALSIEGSHSYVKANSRTPLRSFQYIVIGKWPDARLWTQYWLLESIRSGCLRDELEAHANLARIFDQVNEPLLALEHAVLGGSQELVKELALKVGEWPEFLANMVSSDAPWVRRAAFLALEYVGDFAPPEVARGLVPVLRNRLCIDADDDREIPILLKALGAIILEATDDDLEQLIPILEQAAEREPDRYRHTDPGVMTIAARLYRFRPTFRQQAAAILGEMAVGAHTGEWARTLEACGDDTRDLIEAIERVADREELDLARPLSELGYLTASTHALWSQRLQSVADHPLGTRSEHRLGIKYDVPVEFLREQDSAVVLGYIDKLVAIGSNDGELAVNRAAAFGAAANVIDVLSCDEKKLIFDRVRPFAEQSLHVSEMDRHQSGTQHLLSRFRVNFGGAANVQGAAGWLWARAATGPEECSLVVEIVEGWLRSDDSILQQTAASILTLPNFSSSEVQHIELAKHKDPSVRSLAARMAVTQSNLETTAFEQLASDPDRRVRIEVALALQSVRSMAPDLYERIRARLKTDSSAIVRVCASTLL